MKRIIALVLSLCILLTSFVALCSCDIFVNDPSSGVEDSIGGDDQGNDPILDNDENDDVDDSDTDTDNDNNNDNNDSGNDGDCSSKHTDENNDDVCDVCYASVIVVIDFYAVNDLHGKFCDTDGQPGVDELATYFKEMTKKDDHTIFLSSGDMWQGTAESNLTGGIILTEWMNEMDFVSMTLGNHEYDWGEEAIRKNLAVAEFPFLAINVYDLDTNALADYCTPSVMIERGGVQIGIIGAIGDCYSSISSDMVENVEFKVGRELTNLVKDESQRLRAEGADLIVYSLHDGYGSNTSSSSVVGSGAISSYYDTVLSDGYVDLVFEAHTHRSYTLIDSNGVYHLQGGGENSGISHAEIGVNIANGKARVSEAGVVRSSTYDDYDDDSMTEALEEKYSDIINYAYSELGIVSRGYSDVEVENYVAGLYLEVGIEKWGENYDIVLGGGFLRTRSPYDLAAGSTTYADILSLLPFDNRIVLCSVSGYKLSEKFINSYSSDYYSAYSEYGNSVKNNVSLSSQYYVVVDTYTALYAPNGLTIVDYYDETTFARDLFAEKVKEGFFEVKHNDYTLTSIADALAIGSKLGDNQATVDAYYVKGTVESIDSTKYGNLYLVDESGNRIYVYGVYDTLGNRYDGMSNKPQAGDTIVLCSVVYKYVNGSTVTIELKNATLIVE